jgi:hypothetical protein
MVWRELRQVIQFIARVILAYLVFNHLRFSIEVWSLKNSSNPALTSRADQNYDFHTSWEELLLYLVSAWGAYMQAKLLGT